MCPRPPQCKAVGVLSRLIIANKAYSHLFWVEILKYGLFVIFMPKKWFTGVKGVEDAKNYLSGRGKIADS